MSSYWPIKSRTYYGSEFGLELILSNFESSSSISVRVGEESQEDGLKIISV